MPVYLVTYDLVEAYSGEKRNYQPIWDALDTFDNHEVLYSVYLVEAESAVAVEQVIKPALRKGDRHFITRLRPNEHRYAAMQGTNQWLADHPPG